jgi:hypothetical protein
VTRTIDRLYHATPLHYLPAIFAAGALYAKNVLAASPPLSTDSLPFREGARVGVDSLHSREGAGVGVSRPEDGSLRSPSRVSPRRTAQRRDLMLGLGDYVHLSPRPASPLLADKITKGYPHAVLVFDGPAVLGLADTAVLPYNTKAWRTRSAYAPVTDPGQREALLNSYLSGYRLPSLEILVKYGLSLGGLQETAFINDSELRMTVDVLAAIGCGDVDGRGRASYVKTTVAPELFGMPSNYRPRTLAAIRLYFDDCRSARMLRPAPHIEFD